MYLFIKISSVEIIAVYLIMYFKHYNNIRCTAADLDCKKCYDRLGCISVTPEWKHPKYRPINILPAERHAVNTIFVQCVKRESNVTPEIIGTNGVNFINSTLKLLVHDFTSNGYSGWIQHLSRVLLLNPHSGLSVVSVDWAAGAEPPYVQAIANARLVALEIIHFLENVQITSNVKPRDVHIIGHGVGAHIAGYVGKMNRLKRITALDPAGLYFENMPAIVRLYKMDAIFIEVLHTNALPRGQGNKQIMGHVDFFANGGIKQPGCKDALFSLNSIKRGDLKGKCTCGVNMENCVRLNSLRPPRSLNNMAYGYYFVTSSSHPFCGEMLKVVISIQSGASEELYVNGYFNITIPQSIGDVNFLINENSIVSALRTNTQHTFLVFRTTPPPLILPIDCNIHLEWLHRPLACFWCIPPKITSFMIQKMTDNKSDRPQMFCATNSPSINMFDQELQQCKETSTL